MKICIVITAAGLSTRQTRNKLLIRSCHETVIEKTVSTFLGIGLDIFVVIGFEKNKMIPILQHRFGNDIEIVVNKEYKTGMASSIKSGIQATGKNYDYYGFCNGDKPYIKTSSVSKLIHYISQNKTDILVPLYRKEGGHPAFFDKKFLKDFEQLVGDVGGIEIINRNPNSVTYLPINDEGITLDMDKYLEHQ
jgi:molybdenum cofactor cytidylyltransferase